MNEDELKKQLAILSSNAERIVVAYNNLLSENARLTKEIKALNTELNTKRERLKIVEEQYNTLRLAQMFGGGQTAENQIAKQKLNKILREIDNCITLLKTSK